MTARRTVAFSKNSSNLFFHILTKCNLRCRHCYINPEQQGKKILSLVTIKTWLDEFVSTSATTNVIFLGGEPTLHPDLAQAIKYAGRADEALSSVPYSAALDELSSLTHLVVEREQ